MKRALMLESLKHRKLWDFLVIGGGASGLGVALDAASRGFSTLLFEKGDFACGTSSRSTKLIHGGLRYLRQGRFSLVQEALRERAFLLQRAPHLVHPQAFILPARNWLEFVYYFSGAILYELLSGKKSIARTEILKKARLNHIFFKNFPFQSGIRFFDAQFDDARLAINLATTIVEKGGSVINYMPVVKLLKSQGKVSGVVVKDLETGQEYEVQGKTVINATGIFTDSVRRLDERSINDSVVLSQGTHIVLDRKFFPGESALIIPKTKDNRPVFIIPWYGKLLIGTTDIFIKEIEQEPKHELSEIEFLLSTVKNYLMQIPTQIDILSVFSGIRPLIKPKSLFKKTSDLSRDYLILRSSSDLISIVGGKWTTYRQMAENVVDFALKVSGLPFKACQTKEINIHGWIDSLQQSSEWNYYGADLSRVEELPYEKKKMHPQLPLREIDVRWGVRNEMAHRLDDILSRRSRALILDAKASVEIAPQVAAIMAEELGYSQEWEVNQVTQYRQLAKGYTV